jgi:hypothetical protein
MSVRHAVIAFALLTCAHSAQAHGIAGNRFFVGTLTFDDPAVADEAILPGYSGLDHPAEGGNVLDNRINWSFKFQSTAAGYTATGPLRRPLGSTRQTSELRARFQKQ